MTKIFRLIFDLATFSLVFVAPWWLSLAAIVVGIFVFRNFYEAFVLAFLMDAYHGVTGFTFYRTNAIFIFTTTIVFVAAMLLKPRLRFFD